MSKVNRLFHDPRQCLTLLRRLGYVKTFLFWESQNTEARWIVESNYHKLDKGVLEEHRYSAEELKVWVRQLEQRYPGLRKALHG